jgi:uncharacterized protein YegL
MSPAASHPRMPEGSMPRRPLHFIILADCSDRMRGDKIQALNDVIEDMLPHLAAWERDNPQAQVLVRAIAFATEPRWYIPDPVPVTEIRWTPLQPVPEGLANMGPAFALAAQALAPGQIERRALRPALLLITAGRPTDPPGAFEADLAMLMAQPAGKAALRLSVAIGRDAQVEPLSRFIGDPSVPILVDDSNEIADRLVAAPLGVAQLVEPDDDRGALARRLLEPSAPAQRRYLRAQCPDGVAVGKAFSLLVSIAVAAGPGSAELEPFDIPSEGRDVLLVVHAPGLRLLGDQRQIVHVPEEGNSRPVMFELRADAPGPQPVSVTA